MITRATDHGARASTWGLLATICCLYGVAAVVLLWRLGVLENIPWLMFSSPDAGTYLRLSDFLVGKTSTVNPALVRFRPFLYPLFLALHDVTGL